MRESFDSLLNQLSKLAETNEDANAFKNTWEAFLKREKRSKEILSAVFNNINHVILVIDPETRSIIHCNKAIKDVFGYDSAEVIGRNTLFLHLDEHFYDGFAEQSESVLKTGNAFNTEYPLKRKDGSQIYTKITVTAIEPKQSWVNGVISIIEDITEEREKDRQRRRNINRLRLMTEQVPTILWTTDSNLMITSILGKEAYKLKTDEKPLINRKIQDIFTARQDLEVIKSHERALSGERASYEILYQDCIFKAYVEPMYDTNNAISGVIGLAYDITEQKSLEERYKERVKELECLSALSELNITYNDYSLGPFVEKTIRIIQDAFHFPMATSVKIEIQGNEYVSKDFKRTEDVLRKKVRAYNDEYGGIEVFVDRGRIPESQSAFLDEERTLLSIIAERLGRIIERKIENDMLSNKTKHLQAIVDSAIDSIALIDDDARYVEVNPATSRVTGYTEEELLKMKVVDIIDSHYIDLFKETWNTFLEKGIIRGELGINRKDGQFRVIEYRAAANVFPGIHLSINRDITSRKQHEEVLENTLREREVLIQEIHHRVKNNLQIIASMLNLQLKSISEPSVLAKMEDTKTRVYAMAMVYEQLHASENLEIINIKDYLEKLVRSLAGPQTNIRVHFDIEALQFNIDQAIPCGLIVNELLTNSLKHAFPDRKEGSIRISLRRNADARIQLRVQDDGVGIPDKFLASRTFSLGLELIHILADQLDGEVEITNDSGTDVLISFGPL